MKIQTYIHKAKKMKNKGYILTWDALLALMIVLLTFATLLALGYLSFSPESSSSFERLHFLGEDTLDVLNKNGVLEKIATHWSQNNTENATEIADHYLKDLELIPSKFGYRLEIEGKNISEHTLEIPESEITAKTSVVRFVSGFGLNKTPDVYVARAWLLYNNTDTGKTYSLERVVYGNSFKIASGGNWTVNHLSGISKVCIPADCSGDDEHTYSGNCDDPQNDDALDDAMYRLLHKLDPDENCVVNLHFDPNNMEFKTSSIPTKQLDSELVEVRLILWI